MDEKQLKINEKLKSSCEEVVELFDKLDLEQFADLRSQIKWCIGSYNYDQNASGLFKLGTVALEELTAYKKENNARKVTKKILGALEKALKAYTKAEKKK